MINWYKIVKKAQIWKSKFPEELVDKFTTDFNKNSMEMEIDDNIYAIDAVKLNLYKIYELSYKYQYIKNKTKEFDIHPKRKDNILNNIEEKIRNITKNLKKQINPIIEYWIYYHTSGIKPFQEEIIKEIEENDEGIKEMFIFAGIGRKTENDVYEEVISRLDEMPHLNNLLENKGVYDEVEKIFEENAKEIEIEIESIEYDIAKKTGLNQRKIENMNYEMLKKYFEKMYNDNEINEMTYYELLNNIEDRKISNEQLSNEKPSDENIESVLKDVYKEIIKDIIMNSDKIIEIVKEIQKVRYDFWIDQFWDALQEPIENIKKAKEMLENIEEKPIDKIITDINIILNTMHTSGKIMDYFQILKHSTVNENFLTFLSNLDQYDMTDKWEKEIEEMGMKTITSNNMLIKLFKKKYK